MKTYKMYSIREGRYDEYELWEVTYDACGDPTGDVFIGRYGTEQLAEQAARRLADENYSKLTSNNKRYIEEHKGKFRLRGTVGTPGKKHHRKHRSESEKSPPTHVHGTGRG